MKMRIYIAIIAFFMTCLSAVVCALAGQPAVSHLRITDVSPLSFSVVWISSEPSNSSLRVFDARQKELTSVTITSESSLHPPAEDLGVMKVRVSRLKADTTYYLQTITTAKADAKVTVHPKKPIRVRTEKSAIPVNNLVLAQKIYFENQSLGNGCLMVVSVKGGSYPVTGWVGGQANPPSPWALIDLNNIYSGQINKNLEMFGGETMTIEALGGKGGYFSYSRKIPSSSDGQIIEIKPPIVLSNSN